MLTLIATGDRESDLYHWYEVREKHPELKSVPSIDSSTPQGAAEFARRVETISFFGNTDIIVAHSVEINPQLAHLMNEYTGTIYIITTVGKVPKTLQAKSAFDKCTDQMLKNLISTKLRTLSLSPTKEDMAKLYFTLSIEDYSGKERLSPLRCRTLARQLMTIEGSSPEDAKKLFTNLIGLVEGKASQWELLANLFTTQKRKQKEYFQSLSELMTPYEIMSLAKSTLLLVYAIMLGRKDHLDSASIATKLGKHPFYISSLLRTVEEKGITIDKVKKIISRFLNLEMALKSGKFDDEYFGFEVLLATM